MTALESTPQRGLLVPHDRQQPEDLVEHRVALEQDIDEKRVEELPRGIAEIGGSALLNHAGKLLNGRDRRAHRAERRGELLKRSRLRRQRGAQRRDRPARLRDRGQQRLCRELRARVGLPPEIEE